MMDGMTSERISVEINGDLRFLPIGYLTTWSNDGFIVRKSARDMWQYIQTIVVDPSIVGTYLTGPMGVGKSSIMYYVVHKAREEGWFVIYIPRCDEWVRKGYPCKIDWYSYLMDGILTGLKYVKSETVKTTYAYCIPPNNHPSWRKATLKEGLSLEYFHNVFRQFRAQILMEVNIPVLLAFDESQALFNHGINVKVDAPFSLIDWASYYERGCIFVTATEDSPYQQSLRGGHEQYVRNTECLLEDEFALWIQTGQFDKIVKHPDFTVNNLVEIQIVTGNIPLELVLLSEEYCDNTISLHEILEDYSNSRQAAYMERYCNMKMQHPKNIQSYVRVFFKFFTQITVKKHDIPIELLDIGLVYIRENSIVPLNSNALQCFLQILKNSKKQILEEEVRKILQNLKSFLPAKVGSAFEKLFGWNLLFHRGRDIVLKYQSCTDATKQICTIQIHHFLIMDGNKPTEKSWKDYPSKTLVAHSKGQEDRMDFIYFGGSDDCILFFELTVGEEHFGNPMYPNWNDDDDDVRQELILNRMSKWLGHSFQANPETLLPPPDYNGVVEYIVVPSRVHDNDDDDGIPFHGNQKMKVFPWISIMDPTDLRLFFPEAHIEKLVSVKNDAKRLKRSS